MLADESGPEERTAVSEAKSVLARHPERRFASVGGDHYGSSQDRNFGLHAASGEVATESSFGETISAGCTVTVGTARMKTLIDKHMCTLSTIDGKLLILLKVLKNRKCSSKVLQNTFDMLTKMLKLTILFS